MIRTKCIIEFKLVNEVNNSNNTTTNDVNINISNNEENVM